MFFLFWRLSMMCWLGQLPLLCHAITFASLVGYIVYPTSQRTVLITIHINSCKYLQLVLGGINTYRTWLRSVLVVNTRPTASLQVSFSFIKNCKFTKACHYWYSFMFLHFEWLHIPCLNRWHFSCQTNYQTCNFWSVTFHMNVPTRIWIIPL